MSSCQKWGRGFYLSTSIRVPQDIGLSKVTMGRKDNNIEHHWDCSEELLQGGWIRGLEKVQEKVDSLTCTLSTVAPTFLQTKFLEPELCNDFSSLLRAIRISMIMCMMIINSTGGGTPSMGCQLEGLTDVSLPS